MQTPAYRSPSADYSRRPEAPAAVPSRRERLAIVAPSSKLCGVAAYTAALCRQLDDAFDLHVFNLDQYLLRSVHRRLRKLGDRHVKEIAKALRSFDAVNLQLEHGTLGRNGRDIYQRFCWLTNAAPRLSVTFHSLHLPPGFDTGHFASALVTGNVKAAVRAHAEFRRAYLLSHGIARQLRRLQRHKQVSAVVHNRRDYRDVRYLYGLQHVFDHPLSYLRREEVDAVRTEASRARFPMVADLPDTAKLIGVFGFLNEYKGIETAIKALQHLPGDYHLLIFGGIHPQEIKSRQSRHPYISSLFDHAYVDMTRYRELTAAESETQLIVSAESDLAELLGPHPRDVSGRIHFMGSLDEADFLAGMIICDAVVFPYLEVGQSASGPISQALELGCRIVASRTHTFLEFAEYHRNAIELFEIGNHLELAERLAARPQFDRRQGLPEFNVATNKATYLLAMSPIVAGASPSPDRLSLRTRRTEPSRADAIGT